MIKSESRHSALSPPAENFSSRRAKHSPFPPDISLYVPAPIATGIPRRAPNRLLAGFWFILVVVVLAVVFSSAR